MTDMTKRGLGLAALASLAGPGAALAAPGQARPAAPTAAARPRPGLPSPIAILAMTRSALLAVDHANRTGNYTVLRDLAGPQFREANTAARLAQIFGPVTTQGVDLLAVAVVEPAWREAPAITPEGKLHVAGTFRMPPKAANFEILFEPVGTTWRIFAIGVAAA